MNTLYCDKKYNLKVNMCQAAILDLFNRDKEYTCKRIKSMANINDSMLKQALEKLCNPKQRLLYYDNKKPDFKDDELISVNKEFQSNRLMIDFTPKSKTQINSASKEEINP